MKNISYKCGIIGYYTNIEVLSQDEKGNSSFKCDCGKCGGTGKLPVYSHVDNGVCFKCGGSGREIRNTKLYTQEEAETLVERYRKNIEKKLEKAKEQKEIDADKNLNDLITNLGIADNDLYVVVDNNSFNLKEVIKANGYKFTHSYWVGSKPIVGIQTIVVDINEVYNKYEDRFDNLHNIVVANEPKGCFYGVEGGKFEVEVTYLSRRDFVGYMGKNMHSHIFETKDKEVLVWVTSAIIDRADGSVFKIKGTVKSHKEYKGKNQTEISRVRVVK